jgi:DNA polymerase
VPGEGPADAAVLFVGEAPGEQEDLEGRPFCGRSGAFFDDMLALAGLGRADVFVTSTVKCRPPGNRNPTPQEWQTCRDRWLRRQVEIVGPALIVLLGKIALECVLSETGRLADLHGKVHEWQGRRCLVTYHPAAGMRFPAPGDGIRTDFRRLGQLVGELEQGD